MSKLWPFASKEKAQLNELDLHIKSLEEKLEFNDDLNAEIESYHKSYDLNESTNVLGTFGVVDEFLDKGMLQRLYCTETWFFIAVHTIAKTIASLPIKLEKKKVIKQRVSQQDGSTDDVSKTTWIDASGEPEHQILSHPNSLSTPVEFWMLVVIDLLATGDAFIYVDKGEIEQDELIDNGSTANRLRQAINRTAKTNVRGLYRLSSALVQPIASTNSQGVLAGYSIQTQDGFFTFDKNELIHIRLPNPIDPFYGLAPIMSVMKNLLLDRYTAEHMLRFYKQGARLGGVIKTNKKLTKDQLIRLERIFESNFTGKRNHHKTLVLPEGMDYSTIEQNPGETSLIEFMKGNKEPILAAYNVPPIKVGLLDGATFANANIQDKTYYNDTIKPLLAFIEQAINTHGSILSPARELKFSFDLSDTDALQDDVMEMAKNASYLEKSGMSVNEIRERVWKLPPIDGGEICPLIVSSQAPAAPFIPYGKGVENKTEVANVQNDTATLSDIKPTKATYAERVGELVSASIAAGIDPTLAVQQAIEQAKTEGLSPDGEVTEEGKKFETEIKVGAITKEMKTEHLKNMTGEGVAPLIEDNKKSFDSMFSRMEKMFVKKLKSKMKSYKVKTDQVPEDFFEISDIQGFEEDEMKWYIESMLKAMRNGYKNTLSNRPMTFPNERAAKVLEEIGAQRIKGITETTMNQMNRVIADSFKDQVSVTEVASRIRDVFDNISKGRANTIARTETLTAVSIGQRQKVYEFKDAYPEEAKTMRKVWLTAEDDLVRDSHAELDGVELDIDEPFDNGLMFPRDPDGDAGEIINCRCSTIEFLPDSADDVRATLADTSPIASAVDKVEE
jgi:HK97 family phage portal protein